MKTDKDAFRAMLVVTIIVTFLITLKLTIGFISHSSVLISEGVESSSDFVVAIISLIGLSLAGRSPDKKFPYGYYKIENFLSFAIASSIVVSSVILIIKAIVNFTATPVISYPLFALAVAVLSAIVSLILGLYLMSIGRKTNSPTIKANSKDKLIDSARSVIVFVTILFSYFHIKYVEAVVTILIALIAIKIAFDLGKDALFALLDFTDTEMENTVKAILEKRIKDGVILSYNELRIRKAGSYCFGDCEVNFPDTTDLKEAHNTVEEIKAEIHSAIPSLISLVVHIEPIERDDRVIAFPVVEEDKGLDSRLANSFGRTPLLLLVTTNLKTREIEKLEAINNPNIKSDKLVGYNLAKELVSKGINTVVVKTIGEISFAALKAQNIDIIKAERDTVKDCLDQLYRKEITHIEVPINKNASK